MPSNRYNNAHGTSGGKLPRYKTGPREDTFPMETKIRKAAYAKQHGGGEGAGKPSKTVVNKKYADEAGFEVYKEVPMSRRGMRGRIRGRAY
jgi:hypothetical protein